MSITFDDIKKMRLAIADPPDVINLEPVQTTSDLPATPAPQTAYKVVSNGGYYQTDLVSGATAADYKIVELQMSDARIVSLADMLGVNLGICRALHYIAARLGSQLRLARIATGAESTEFTRLLESYNYYKALAADCEKNNAEDSGQSTGKWGATKQPEIAGGCI